MRSAVYVGVFAALSLAACREKTGAPSFESTLKKGPVLALPEEFVGMWQGQSTGSFEYKRTDYLWNLDLDGTGRLLLELTNSNSGLIENFTGYWSVDDQIFTLHTEQKGAFLFPFPSLDTDWNGDYLGYYGRIIRREESEVEIFFSCVDLIGGDHTLTARMVEQYVPPKSDRADG